MYKEADFLAQARVLLAFMNTCAHKGYLVAMRQGRLLLGALSAYAKHLKSKQLSN